MTDSAPPRAGRAAPVAPRRPRGARRRHAGRGDRSDPARLKSPAPRVTLVPEDASLEDFLNGGESDDAEEATESHESAGDARDDRVDGRARETTGDDPSPDPARSVSRVAPSGEACAACGDAAVRLWADDAGPVCVDCKSW